MLDCYKVLNSYAFPSPSYLIPRRTQLPGNPPLPQPVNHEHPLHRCGTWSGKGCYLGPRLPGATAVTGTPPGSPPSDNSSSCLYASFQAGSICISVSSPVLKWTGVSERSQSCPNSWGYWATPRMGHAITLQTLYTLSSNRSTNSFLQEIFKL